MSGAQSCHWVARCKYPGKNDFNFYSTAFVVDSYDELDSVAAAAVVAEWSRISPHPPPEVVELIPGFLQFHHQTK